MDQLKPVLIQLKKHHFWVINGLVVLLALVGSVLSSSAMSSKFDDNKKIIESQHKKLTSTRATDSPNKECQDAVVNTERDLQNSLFTIWNAAYEAQKAIKVWPAEIRSEIPESADAEIKREVREQYDRFVIEPELDRIFVSVANVRRPRNGAEPAKSAGSKTTAPTGPQDGVVEWDAAARDGMKKRYRTADKAELPTAKMRAIQEDLWVIEALVGVIGDLNENATDPYNAKVKKIEALDVAQWAISAAQSEKISISGAAQGAGGAMGGGMGGAAGGGGMKSMNPGAGGGGANPKMRPGANEEGGGDGGEKTELSQWMAGRYLDEKGEPLKAEASQPFNEYKQLFVRVKLVMNEPDIPEVLSAYANHPQMPMEIRRVMVRYGGEAAQSAGAGAAGGGGAGGGGAGGMGATAPTGGGAGASGPPASGGSGGMGAAGATGGAAGAAGAGGAGGATKESNPEEVSLEICGVIRIYMEPKVEKIGGGSAGGAGLARNLGIPKGAAPPPAGGGGGGAGGAMMGGGSGGMMGPAN